MSLVNTGTTANDNTGDTIRHAFDLVNDKLAQLEAITPNVISGANALTLDNMSVNERVAQGTLIGNIGNRTAGSTLRLYSPTEYCFQVNGTRLEAGPWLLDTGNVPVILEEVVVTAIGTITRQTILNITVNRDAVTWPAVAGITKYVAPTARGTGDGLTAANAKAISSVVGTLVPGDVVGVLADVGTYNISTSLALTSSGTAASHIKWVGVDSTNKRTLAKLTGQRWPYRKQTQSQEEVINLATFADSQIQGINVFSVGQISYVDFEDLFFEDALSCFAQTNAANPDHLTFTRMHFHNVQRLYEHAATNGHANCTFNNIVGFGFSKAVVRFRGTASFLTVNTAYCDSQRQDNDQWASFSQIDNTAHDWTFSNVTMLNSHNNQGGAYWNGDGASAEEFNPGGTFVNWVSKGHTDAGLDLKTSATIIGGIFGDCKRNLKFWNGEFDVQGPTFLPPKKRGNGSGSACHININQNTAGKCPHVRISNADLRLFGQANAYEIDFDSGLAGNSGAVVKYINCQRDAVPLFLNNGSHIRFMIAAAAPTGAVTLTNTALTVNEGSGAAIPIATNRDASYGGVLIRSIGGADAALFTIASFGGVGKHGQAIVPVAPFTYTGTSSDTKNITLTVEDVAGTQATVALTVSVIHDTTDYRVFDVTFTGVNNSQTATDASPHAHVLTYGANAKISTAIDAAGRLRIFPPASNATTNLVRTPDSADWVLSGDFTIEAEGLNFISVTTLDGSVAPTADRILCGQYQASSGQFGWALALDTSGRLCALLSLNGTSATRFTGTTVLSASTDYRAKITRVGSTVKLWLDKFDGNGWQVEATGTLGGALFDDAIQFTVGSSASGNRTAYINAHVKRVVIHNGTGAGA